MVTCEQHQESPVQADVGQHSGRRWQNAPFCPFHSRKKYLLCELACFLLSTSSPDSAVGTSQSDLGCFVLQHSQALLGQGTSALSSCWQSSDWEVTTLFTAPHKSASRFFPDLFDDWKWNLTAALSWHDNHQFTVLDCFSHLLLSQSCLDKRLHNM